MEKRVVNPVWRKIIERTNKQICDKRNETLFIYSLDLEISLFFRVVVTTTAAHTKNERILNNKTTNCRWNNFGNVVHSLNIINELCLKDDGKTNIGEPVDWYELKEM